MRNHIQPISVLIFPLVLHLLLEVPQALIAKTTSKMKSRSVDDVFIITLTIKPSIAFYQTSKMSMLT